jgi:large repetitive protein
VTTLLGSDSVGDSFANLNANTGYAQNPGNSGGLIAVAGGVAKFVNYYCFNTSSTQVSFALYSSTKDLLASTPAYARASAGNWLTVPLPGDVEIIEGEKYFLVVRGNGYNQIGMISNSTGSDFWNNATLPTFPTWPDPLPGRSGGGTIGELSLYISGDAAANGPAITDITTTRYSEPFTITGTNFGDVQGTVSLGGINQTVNSWTPTSITCGCSRGTLKYGTYDVLVTADGAQTAAAPTDLLPQTDWDYVDLAGTLAPSVNRLTATPTDLAAGMQVSWQSNQAGKSIGVYSDGSFVCDADVTSFPAQAWSLADGWGTSGTQTISQVAAVAPIITTTTLGTITVGTAYSLQLLASGDVPITWTRYAGTIPAGLTLSASGQLSGTPTAPGANYNFTVEASNAIGADTQVYTGYVGQEPAFTGETIPQLRVGVPYSGMIQHTGFPEPVFSTAGGAMPAGMTLDSTGLVHGTPTTAGAYGVNIRQTNSVTSVDLFISGSVLAAFTVPVITTTTLPQMSQNVAYDQQIEFTGNPNPTLAVQSGTLPAGLVLETTGRLHGTPTVAAAYSFTVRATNSQGFDDQLFTGSVSAALSPPVITTTALQQPYRTVPYSQQIYATGNPAPTFALQTGTLPAGLTLSSSGLLSGIPTTTGLSNFTVRATNSQGFDDQAYTVNVLPAPNGYAVRVTLV